MKLIKNHLSSLLTGICSALLSLLGFSCTSPEDVPDMYGTPTGDFEIKGAVTNNDGAKIADAQIRVTFSDTPSGLHSLQTTTTNADGQYLTYGQSYAASELKVVCIPSDPELEADSVIVKLHYDKDNAGLWYAGEAKETVDFILKERNQ